MYTNIELYDIEPGYEQNSFRHESDSETEVCVYICICICIFLTILIIIIKMILTN